MKQKKCSIVKQRTSTFILTPDKIYYQNNFHTFYLEPRSHYWRKRLSFIRALIEVGEIYDYPSLLHYTNGKIDVVYTMGKPRGITKRTKVLDYANI